MTTVAKNQLFNIELLKLITKETDDADFLFYCLIGGEQLNENHVRLNCNHKFNYINLLNEVCVQRQKNVLEIQTITKYQIKCPYCRGVQNGIMPYIKDIVAKKMLGVNWPPSKIMKNERCKAVLKSGKRRNQRCNKPSCYKYCKIHNTKTTSLAKTAYNICMAIIKSGKRKGELCKCKRKSNRDFCGRHIQKSI